MDIFFPFTAHSFQTQFCLLRGFHHLEASRSGNTLVQPRRAPCATERKICKSIFHQAAVATVRNQLLCTPGMEQETRLVQRRKVTHLQIKMHHICTKHIYCTKDRVSLLFLFLPTSLQLMHNTEPTSQSLGIKMKNINKEI